MALRVKNWSRYQHYKDRCPPWIKLATDTFQNYDFSRLNDASKLLAVCIWTLASRSKDGEVPDDFDFLKAQGCLGDSVKQKHLDELITKGFLERSNLLADCEQSACSEAEAEAEERQIAQATSVPSEFEVFWQAYPKKKNRGQAEKAWRSEAPPIADVVAALLWQRALPDWRKDGGQYIPYPATYIRAKGWLDEPPATNGTKSIADVARGSQRSIRPLAGLPGD